APSRMPANPNDCARAIRGSKPAPRSVTSTRSASRFRGYAVERQAIVCLKLLSFGAPMRVFIADDHSVVRRGLQQIITAQPGWKVGGEAATADDVLPALRAGSFDVLVLDISLGGRSGIDLLG